MEIKEFIDHLEKLNFSLAVENEKLMLKGDKKRLSKQEIEAIKTNDFVINYIRENKEQLIGFLSVSSDKGLADKKSKNIASIYQLTGLQQGMLFHGLYDTGTSSYINQLSGVLIKPDLNAFAKSWEMVMKKHTILRTAFHYDAFSVPVQTVYKEVELPLEMLDYRSLIAEEQSKAVQQYQEADRIKAFDFKTPPLMRVALLRLSNDKYQMLVTIHHILIDGWSLQILFQEFLTAYDLLTAGEIYSIANEDRFEDYVRYISKAKEEGDEIAYWKDYLKDVNSGTLLPFVKANVERTKGLGIYKTESLQFSSAITSQILHYTRTNRITVNTLMQGVWALVLNKYTNNSDVVYGVIVSGRPDDLPGVEQRVGLYINTLPLHAKVDQSQKAADWLQQLQSQQAASRKYQHTPLKEIQEAVGVQGAFFDTVLVFENYPVNKLLAAKKWSLQIEDLRNFEHNNYPLSIEVGIGESIKVNFNCNIDLVDEYYLLKLGGHFEQVLLKIVGDESVVIGNINLLIPAEKDLIVSFNNRQSNFPHYKSIVELFEAQVAATPLSIAVRFEEVDLSYQELNEKANQLAHYLRSKGVKNETLVPISIERSADLIVAILGTLKAGAAYVPIDPGYPGERIAFMLKDTMSSIMISTSSVIEKLVIEDVEIVEIDRAWKTIEVQSKENVEIDIAPNSLAYVIYTSGSTGRPKGVLVEHQNVVSLVKGVDYVSLTEKNILLSTGSPSFDATTFEYWSMLLNGGQLILCAEEDLLNSESLKEQIVQRNVDIMWFTSSWFNELVETDITVFAPLKTILAGGEKLSEKHIEKVRQTYPHVALVNGYGPTENTTFSVTHSIAETSIQKPIPIGRPLNNRTAYVLNNEAQLVPVGVAGEICLGGAGLSRGYLNLEKLTAEKFIESPFKKGERLYKTGDIGRFLPDGIVEYLGRVDEQVKIRGYRIEIGEIETVLLQNEFVSQCVVAVKEDDNGSKRLVAYVVPNDVFNKQALAEYMHNRLPEYMVPSLWVELDNMPLTSNGKVDKRALPDAEAEELLSNQYVAPQTELEVKLAEIWKDLLQVDEVGIHDDFFELGGHSLLAIRLISAVRRKLAVEISINTIFEHSTIAQIASLLEQQNNELSTPPLTAQQRPIHIPLSFSQERLWFIDKLEGSVQYHVPIILRLKGALDTHALVDAFAKVVDRHEVLRTVFREQDGAVYQVVKDTVKQPLEVVTNTFVGEDELKEFIQKTIAKPFDLANDNMLRAQLVALNNEEHLLVVTIHHIASDAWSIAILLREVTELYNANKQHQTVKLTALPVQYADYSIWQRNYLKGELLEQKLDYWKGKLKDVELLHIATQANRPVVKTSKGTWATFSIDKDVSSRLQLLGLQEGTTLFITLLAAFKVLLHRYTGQQDICVGSPIANRSPQEVEGLIGFFLNTLAFRTQVDANASFVEVLKQVRATSLEAYQHQDVPFEKVVEAVVKERDLSRNPLFQVMFVLLNETKVSDLNADGLELTGQEPERNTSQFDLNFSLSETPHGLKGIVEYSTDLYDAATIDRMISHFTQLLTSIVQSPNEKIGLLPLLSQQEKQQLAEFNNTKANYPKDKSIKDLFEEQALKTPSATAVLFEEHKLTYQQLNQKSNQLARFLVSKGVKANTLVPICIERSLEMIIGVLAILKAGGTYVPIDPEYPTERIQYMLEDMAVGVALSSKASRTKLSSKEDLEILEIDGNGQVISKLSDANLETVRMSDNLVYILYTSGSTGRPKGVKMPEGGMMNLLSWQQKQFKNHTRKVLQFASLNFDVSFQEIFSTLCFGSTLCLINDERRRDVAEVAKDIENNGVTHLFIPYIVFKNLAEYAAFNSSDVSSLQEVIVAGEQLKLTDDIHAFLNKTGVRLVNQYGPTEAHVVSSYVVDADYSSMLPPIGKPVDNTFLYVLNAHQQLMPLGVPGELYIGGVQVAQGYLNRPELTAEKFIGNPVDTAGRLYKTGDLARWLPDGNLEYLGRIDDQVKIRGFRIELGEIESVLQQSEMVSQAVVIAKEDANGNKQLISYIVPEGAFNREALVAYAKKQLPDYMVPALWMQLNTLPLNKNGKVDKKALPNPDASQLLGNEFIAPRTKAESALADIWKQFLNVEQVSVNDNFFELGGHSLLATRVVSAIRSQLQVELAIKDIFIHPTVAKLAVHIQGQHNNVLLPVIGKAVRPTRIPLSFSQQRLWFIDKLEGTVQYHIPAVLRLQGKLDVAVVENSLKEILSRHEVLRTVFVEEEGLPYQVVKSSDGWRLSIIDGSDSIDSSQLQRKVLQLIRDPYNLLDDYMLKASLIRVDETEHVLIITIHHIAADAWSMSIIVKEILELYAAFVEHRPSHLNVVNLQYADYSIWQRNYLQGDLLDNKLAYWKNKLEDVAPLQMPTDFVRPAVRSSKGAWANFTIDKDVAKGIKSLSQKQGTSLFMALLVGFKVMLHKYSGQQDICVGTSIANRTQKELEGLVGFFANTLALRTEVSDSLQFTELLQQEKNTTLEAYEHQEVPFEKVVDAVIKDRDSSRSPLFQVMLVLLNTPEVPELSVDGLSLVRESFEANTSKFDFSFFVFESGDGLQGGVEYSTDLYTSATITRLTAHYQHLLRSIVSNPDQKVSELNMLAEEEVRELQTFNRDAVVYPKEKTVVTLFEEQAARTPDAPAVVFEGVVLSYQELNERSNQLAHYLRHRGVKEDQLVPMCIERSAGMMVAMLGILKAGAGYVPIDTDFPSDRISYMLEDTAASVVVSSKASRSKLTSASAEVIEIDGGVLDNQPTHNPTTNLQPHHLAYVIYTSGSTGQPKGVMIEHRNLVDYVWGLNQKTQIGECRSYALVSTIATDLGNTVIYSSLLLGGALHIFSKESVSNIEYLHEYFADNRIDCLKIVPSHFKAVSNEGALLLPRKLLVFGGEALQADVIEDIRAEATSTCRIVNHYGPTETTIGKLLHVVDRSTTYSNTVPIGKPFSNTRVYVLSKSLQLCPIGVPGQLYIAGDGVARGYLNNTDLTAARFIKDPFDKEGQSLMYATGDQVKYLDKGEIEFIGRIDNQVKIRGYRVEPGEIESMLQQCRGVSQGVVVAGKDKQGNNRLTGYVVPQGAFDREGIISQLKEKLPEYMIPAMLVELESLPLTPNGKVDRKALPDPEAGEVLGDQYVAPRNEAEEKLADIWQDVLEVDQVGVHDDFFELGGHSLLAVRLISAIRKAFKVEMPISHVFDYPTVALLAGQLESQSTNVLPPIEVVQPRPAHIPLSFSQERLWFIDKLEGSVQYHVPAVLGLKGRLNTAALEFALKTIVNRHEVLRTVFIEQDGQARQQVKDNDQWQLSQKDGREYKDDRAALQQHIQELISEPFDLSKDDMLRAALITLSEEEHVLVVTLHHIASDGWSRSILVREVAALYAAFEENRPVQLAPLPVQYADYALWQREYLQGEVLDSKLQYWKDKLQDTEPLQLPTDYTRPAVQTTRGAIKGFNINKEVTDRLQRLSSRYDTTMFMTLLAAFKVLLYNYSQQEDICVGTPTAGRHQQELEGLIGFFVNTLALRSEVSGQATFKELLQQVRNTTLEAYEHQEVPFEKVVEAVVKERNLSRSPLFHVMFVMRNTPDVPDLQISNLTLSAEGYEHTTAMFDLIVYITETSNGLHTAIEYSTDLYNADTVTRMFVHFNEILKAVTQVPEQRIGLLPMLTAEEQQTLAKFNDTTADFPEEKTLKDLFEEQVQKTPEGIALIFEDQQLTYAELNKRANKLAAHLQGRGVKPETLVPICIERSFEMIVGVIGILKAGGVYVPIDPEYPAERIKYMIEDTKSFLVVTNRKNASNLPLGEQVEIIDIMSDEIASCSESELETTVLPQNLAYLLYTSGSTGLPKGVMMPHKNLVNLLWWQEGQFANKKRKVLQFASLNFDVSFQEIFSTLCFGSTLCLISGDRRKDMYEVFKDVSHYGLTHLFVPFLILKNFAELLNSVPFDGLSLEEVIVAGEQLKLTEDIQNIIKNSDVKIINQYGPTEAHVVSSYKISKNSNLSPLPPIGKPVNNTYIQIINRDGQLSPIGVPGEISIGGVQVARGYLNKPELTAEKFVNDTLSAFSGLKLYKTGDLGRWLPDGNLEYLGRADDQVKIRGYRIELGEIESILQQSDLVKQAVVLAIDDQSGNKRLVSYVVAQEVFDKDGIASYLKNKLPDYMVPSLFVEVESLKVTRNGKVDKRALPQVNLSDLIGAKYEAPRSETEEALVEIWRDLLKTDRIGIHDNFFELGGHSLLVIKLVAAIKKRFLLSVPIPVLFQFPTITELASYLDWEQNALQEEDTTEFEEINI